MSFIQNCFLRNAIKDYAIFVTILGYTPMYKIYRNNIEGNNLVLESGTWHFTDSDNHPNCIDCKTNEDLFFALAALRDDSDNRQWFVIDEYLGQEELPNILLGSLHLCTTDKHEDSLPKYFKYHKATPEELIKLFKM